MHTEVSAVGYLEAPSGPAHPLGYSESWQRAGDTLAESWEHPRAATSCLGHFGQTGGQDAGRTQDSKAQRRPGVVDSSLCPGWS